MQKYLIHPATFKLDGGAMFGIIPKPLWSKKIKSDQFNRIKMALRLVLIQTESRNILIDTGIGDYHNQKFLEQFDIQSTTSPIENILSDQLQLKPNDITDIILTHLHFDHVGGLGNKSDIVFENAMIHIHKNHYQYSLNPTLRDAGSFHNNYFESILKEYEKKGQLNLIEGDEGLILKDNNDEVKFLTSFGHTPYMLHPIFDDFIYMADLVPMSHHVRIPWVMGYDIEPGTTTKYKKKFYDYIMDSNLKMIFEHDIDCWGGSLQINEKNQYELKEHLLSNKETLERIG